MYQCWKCGRSVPNEQVKRRNVRTSTHYGIGNFPSSYSRVNLCHGCASWQDKKNVVWVLFCIGGVIALATIYILFKDTPWPAVKH